MPEGPPAEFSTTKSLEAMGLSPLLLKEHYNEQPNHECLCEHQWCFEELVLQASLLDAHCTGTLQMRHIIQEQHAGTDSQQPLTGMWLRNTWREKIKSLTDCSGEQLGFLISFWAVVSAEDTVLYGTKVAMFALWGSPGIREAGDGKEAGGTAFGAILK